MKIQKTNNHTHCQHYVSWSIQTRSEWHGLYRNCLMSKASELHVYIILCTIWDRLASFGITVKPPVATTSRKRPWPLLMCYWNKIFLLSFFSPIYSFKCTSNNGELYFCQILLDRIRSCLLKHFTRKIKITVIRRFDVSNIILKIEVFYANVKVVQRELKILNI